MIRSRNKQESANIIKQLKLNKFPTIVLNSYDNVRITQFCDKYPADYYAVRDMSKSNSKNFNLKVHRDNLLNYTKGMEFFSINVSSYNYRDNQLCVGEIKLDKSMQISITISTNKDFSARDAIRFPEYNLVTNICDKKIINICGIDNIINYIFKYNLFDLIIEFSSFDINVGINIENVIIYEIRTDY